MFIATRSAAVAAAALLVLFALTPIATASPAVASGKKAAKPCANGIRTPGYLGNCKNPVAQPAPPLPAVPLGSNGRDPQTFVDAAGTAHIVWNQNGGTSGPDVLRYCRLKRGSKTCDNPPATRGLVPNQSGQFNDAQFNEDLGGPRILAVGDTLIFITHRYPNQVAKPDGTTSSRTTYEWVSDDGGNTITGPAIIGDAEPSGGAVVYDEDSKQPKIGLISASRTGGTFFQSIAAGQYSGSQALLGSGNQAYSGSLISVGGRPLAAFADLAGNTVIRHFTGNGDPNNAATWSTGTTRGTDPLLTSGPSGAFMVTTPASRKTLDVRKLNDIVPAKAKSVTTGSVSARDLFEDEAGKVHLGWVDQTGSMPELLQRVANGAGSFGSEQVLAKAKAGLAQVDLGATDDGGGFAAFTSGADSQGYGTILASPFGRQTSNGLRGIGNLPGDGADPNTSTACGRIAYGGVEMLNDGSCFSGVKGQPGLKTTSGTLKINGLEIIPDKGVELTLGTRAKTIDADGSVTVQVANGNSPIKLWHGPFHVKFPSGEETVHLPTFPGTGIDVKGFPVTGSFDPVLKNGGVEIPMEIKLPASLGGFTAGVTLRADNDRSLHLDSVHFKLPKVGVGALTLAELNVQWTGSTDTWTGSAGVNLYAANLKLGVEFQHGQFTDGTFQVPLGVYPGISIAPDTFLNDVNGELKLTDATAFARLGVDFGVQPLEPPASPDGTYAFLVPTHATVHFRPSFLLELGGQALLGSKVTVADASVTGDLDGHFTLKGKAQFNFDVVSGMGAFDAFVDSKSGQFAGSIDAHVTVGKSPLSVDVGAKAGISNDQFFVCESPIGGFRYVFKTGGITPYVFSCPGQPDGLEQITQILKNNPELVKQFFESRGLPVPEGLQSKKASASQAGDLGFTIPRGTTGASVTAVGFQGAPNVTLVSPTGKTIVPAPINAAPKGAPVAFTQTRFATVLGLRKPTAGHWRIVEGQAGSIGAVTMARSLPKPKVQVKLSGKGRTRTLRYVATSRPGLAIKLYERFGKAGHRIATITKRRGTVRFKVADGRGGRRTIQADAEQQGMPVAQTRVATFRAPGPAKPAKVRGLRVRRSGGTAAIRWRRARGATGYLVKVTARRGVRMVRLVGGRSVKVRHLPTGSTVSVSVTGRTAKGRTGGAAHVKSKAKSKRSKARHKQRKK